MLSRRGNSGRAFPNGTSVPKWGHTVEYSTKPTSKDVRLRHAQAAGRAARLRGLRTPSAAVRSQEEQLSRNIVLIAFGSVLFMSFIPLAPTALVLFGLLFRDSYAFALRSPSSPTLFLRFPCIRPPNTAIPMSHNPNDLDPPTLVPPSRSSGSSFCAMFSPPVSLRKEALPTPLPSRSSRSSRRP